MRLWRPKSLTHHILIVPRAVSLPFPHHPSTPFTHHALWTGEFLLRTGRGKQTPRWVVYHNKQPRTIRKYTTNSVLRIGSLTIIFALTFSPPFLIYVVPALFFVPSIFSIYFYFIFPPKLCLRGKWNLNVALHVSVYLSCPAPKCLTRRWLFSRWPIWHQPIRRTPMRSHASNLPRSHLCPPDHLLRH